MAGTLRQAQIAKMTGQMPGQVGQQVAQANAQQTTNLQQSIAQAQQVPLGGAQGGGTQAAGQAAGAQQASAQANTAVQAQQQVNQSQAQGGQQLLQQSAQESQQRIQRKTIEAESQNNQAQLTLGNLSQDLKQKLFDNNLQFQKDEVGRTVYNDQQLLDYKLTSGASDEDLANYETSVNQMSQKKMQMLKTANDKLKMELEHSFSQGQQALDQDQQRFLIEKKREIVDKIKKEQTKQANRAGAFTAAGSVIGGVIGAIYGGPAGAQLGSAAGGAVGSMAASSTDSSKPSKSINE